MSRYFLSRAALSAFLAAALLLAGCDAFGDEDDDGLSAAEGVVVGNAGNFSAQNGSLTIYDPETDETDDLESFNALVQSLSLRDDRLYAVLNNDTGSGRIDVFSTEGGSYERTGQLIFPRPPLALAFTGGDRAYVTAQTLAPDFSALPSVAYVVDRDPLTIVDSVAVGPQPVDAVFADDKVFTANYGSLGAGTSLSIIDTDGDAGEAETLELGCDGPNKLFEDDDGEVVVICQGKTVFNDDFEVVEQTDGQVLFVDPEDGTVEGRLDGFNVQLGAVAYSAEREELFVSSGGPGNQVFRIGTDANTRLGTFDIPSDDALTGVGTLAYDAASRRLYVGRRDAGNPFTAAGTVVILERTDDETFEPAGEFAVGVGPADIVFRR
jgi:hypothetical protein